MPWKYLDSAGIPELVEHSEENTVIEIEETIVVMPIVIAECATPVQGIYEQYSIDDKLQF